MFQVFHLDVAKVDMGCCTRCNAYIRMLQHYVSSILSGCCKSRSGMLRTLQCLYTHVATLCFKCFRCMFQVFHLDVVYIVRTIYACFKCFRRFKCMLQVRLDVTKVNMVLHMFQLKSMLPQKISGPLKSEKASSSWLALHLLHGGGRTHGYVKIFRISTRVPERHHRDVKSSIVVFPLARELALIFHIKHHLDHWVSLFSRSSC
jgi:hypothetical protein